MAEDFRTILDNKASEAREARNRLERERKLQEFFREDIRELEFRLDQMSAYIASIEQGIMEIENRLKEPAPPQEEKPEENKPERSSSYHPEYESAGKKAFGDKEKYYWRFIFGNMGLCAAILTTAMIAGCVMLLKML